MPLFSLPFPLTSTSSSPPLPLSPSHCSSRQMSATVQLLKRWRVHYMHPAEAAAQLHLPDFSGSTQPTRDLLNFVTQLSQAQLPPWYRTVVVASNILLCLYLVTGWLSFFYRAIRRTFWIVRWQRGGNLVVNSVNAFMFIQGKSSATALTTVT